MKVKLVYAVVAVLALVSTVALAKRANEVEFVYLNGKGEVVGGKTLHCAGMTSQWGTVTPKYVTSSTPCD
ncbi:DUF6289 family protein [Luteimonas sp. SX5]|uniref:DUF6289 family protein n=1 Tax=Luteimonas galliterrae TaxID=2940486 RepID=A0ABT0MNV5_9GAMM|nr:DUF6289 family protein [Luteimonas galliterrae]MCL1635950.1 DUF6289 family protein [Luteimonas galliterrae]